MAQGKLKVKNKGSLPSSSKKGATKKSLGLNNRAKGARYIAPKKSNLKEAEKLRKGMENAINSNIEQELKELAKKDGKPFKMASLPKVVTGALKKQPKSKKKKRKFH